jgi:hypothetical protein
MVEFYGDMSLISNMDHVIFLDHMDRASFVPRLIWFGSYNVSHQSQNELRT